MKIFVISNDKDKSSLKLTLDSLCNSANEIEADDYYIPPVVTDHDLSNVYVYTLLPIDGKWNKISQLPDSSGPCIVIHSGYYSVNVSVLQSLTYSTDKPTIFKTYPFGYNFRTENAVVLNDISQHGTILEKAIHGEIKLSDKYIGIDHHRYMPFRKIKGLSPLRIALALESDISTCSIEISKYYTTLSKARSSLRNKFKSLIALRTRVTKDKVLLNYIRMLDNCSNSCSKEEYVLYCMMFYPDDYANALNMRPFLLNLCKHDPNVTDVSNLYSLLVDYTLYDPNTKLFRD